MGGRDLEVRGRCDILILGTGIAGLYTALKARHLGRVTVLTKKRIEDSATGFAQGGIAAAIAPGDSPQLHLEDTLAAGDGLCDPAAVRVLVEEGPACVRELAEWGVRFDMAGEDFELTREAAHSRRRILHAGGDATGEEIRRGLDRQVRADPAIAVQEEVFAVDLLVDGGRCCGVVALGRDGRPCLYLARAVVLATGGAGRLYRHSTNPDVATGDGIAMAYRAGAAVMDMEFIQFHPTALYLPAPAAPSDAAADAAVRGEPPAPGGRRPRVLISEAVRGEGAILLNARGERFMPRYHPLAELAPRDVVARAIAREMADTNTPYVLLDARPIGTAFPARFPTIYQKCLQHGIDPTTTPIPVAPAAHYIMGGVRTDTDGRTTIPGLYACGEVACTGVHGANRLASNSLLEGVVFGRRIARALAAELPGLPAPDQVAPGAIPPCPARPPAGFDVEEAWRDLQRLMWRQVGLYRDEASLADALRRIEGLAARLREGEVQPPASRRPATRSALELANLTTVAWLVTRAALERHESRGAHYRSDHPVRDDAAWQKHIVIAQGRLGFVPVR